MIRSRREQYGLEFVLDEMNRLLEMGLISEDDFQGLMRANATTSPIKLIKRPHQTRLPPDQVLAILGHCKDTLSNNVQDSIRDLVAAILDQEKYASLDDMRREIEAKLGVDMQLHLDWLQDTVFHLSKQKLKRINEAALHLRLQTATLKIQRIFRIRRRALQRRRQQREKETRQAADRVARQAIEGYALDVLTRLVSRHIFKLRFRRLVLRLQRQLVEQHVLEIARQRFARLRISQWIFTWWPQYKLSVECRRKWQAVQAVAATTVQAVVKGFLASRQLSKTRRSIAVLQRQIRRYRHEKQVRNAARCLQLCARKWLNRRARLKSLERQHQAAKRIQQCHRQRLEYQRERRAACCVVLWWRRKLLTWRILRRDTERRMRLLKQASSRRIQQSFRNYSAQRQVLRAKATRCIQRVVWRYCLRCHLEKLARRVIQRHIQAWLRHRSQQIQSILLAGLSQYTQRAAQVRRRKERAQRTVGDAVCSWVGRRRARLDVAATRLQQFIRSFLKRQREAKERKRRSSGRVPIRPPARKPHSVPAATKPEVNETPLPPVRLIKRFERLCKTCHSHGNTGQCTHSTSSPVKKMVVVRAASVRVSALTATRANELMLGEKQRRLHTTQSSLVAKPPSSKLNTSVELGRPLCIRKSMSMRLVHRSNQE
ncbi:hypothetical protein AeRB84_016613 [Aphanomyces euteiches]|nr:hypothetical protein AeRB84_016613 [Aphanomyces euteiches]